MESSSFDAVANAARTYGYNNADRLVSAGLAAAGARPAVSYGYGYTGSGGCGTDTGAGLDSARSSGSVTTYGYTGEGDSADLQLGAGNTVAERYVSLPGGVLLTRRYSTSGGDVWSIPDLHGDVIATTGPAGTLTGSGFVYDPYGQPLDPATAATTPSAAPSTRTNGPTDAWEGQHQRGYENANGLNATIMGARLYLPTWGQFGAIDPVEGGNPNPYTYPDDPINSSDLTGEWRWRNIGHFVSRVDTFIKDHRGIVASVLAVGICATTGPAGCAFATAAAFAIRTQQRGYRNVRATARDAIFTGSTFGLSQALRSVIRPGGIQFKGLFQNAAVAVARHLPAVVNGYGNWRNRR